MQRGDDPRVSDPVVEHVQAVVPVILVPAVRPAEMSRVELVVTAAYDGHAERLRAFVIAAVRDGEAADDLVQETFMRFVVELQAGREPANIGGWLYRVCANLIVSRGRRRTVADRMRSLLIRRDVEPSPEDRVVDRERDHILAIALSRLSPDARVALLLAARGMEMREIGLVIRRSPTATRTYIFRARVRLRDELAALGMVPER